MSALSEVCSHVGWWKQVPLCYLDVSLVSVVRLGVAVSPVVERAAWVPVLTYTLWLWWRSPGSLTCCWLSDVLSFCFTLFRICMCRAQINSSFCLPPPLPPLWTPLPPLSCFSLESSFMSDLDSVQQHKMAAGLCLFSLKTKLSNVVEGSSEDSPHRKLLCDQLIQKVKVQTSFWSC